MEIPRPWNGITLSDYYNEETLSQRTFSKLLKNITDSAIRDMQMQANGGSHMKGVELFKSLELSEEELRTLRLNEYFKPKESLLNSSNGGSNASTSTSVSSNSNNASFKKKERTKFFTQE